MIKNVAVSGFIHYGRLFLFRVVSGITEPPVTIVFFLRFTLYPVVSASGLPVLLLPPPAMSVLDVTVPLSFRIGPLSAFAESLIIAVTSELSVEVLVRDDFFWCVLSDFPDWLFCVWENAIAGEISMVAINNIFSVFISLLIWFLVNLACTQTLKYRSSHFYSGKIAHSQTVLLR